MKRIKPVLDGIDDEHADAFARWRILALRGASRQQGYKPRLSLVACEDINRALHLPEDVAWWEPPSRRAAGLDAGLATEIAGRLLQQTGETKVVAVWTRPGPNDQSDSDAAWWAALRRGADIVAVPTPSLLVISRWGWRCLPHGTSRTWQRLRPTG